MVGFYERKTKKRRDLLLFHFRLLIDKQQKECYNNIVIDNGIIILGAEG